MLCLSSRAVVKMGLAAVCLAWLAAPSVALDHTKDTLSTIQKNLTDDKAVLVDVREKSEWDAGHIEDAVCLPLSELGKSIDEAVLNKKLPKDRIIYTHCAAGGRSCKAADFLKECGYDVRPLKPGYKDLISHGFKKAQ